MIEHVYYHEETDRIFVVDDMDHNNSSFFFISTDECWNFLVVQRSACDYLGRL